MMTAMRTTKATMLRRLRRSEVGLNGSSPSFDYIRDPAEIYRRSFKTVRAEADLGALPADVADVAQRLIHACGMIDLVDDLRWSDGAAEAGRGALRTGATVFVDAEMVAAGIVRDRLPANNAVICTLNDGTVPERASQLENTRSAAAVDLWDERLEGAVVSIGNAPTALFRLMERLIDGAPKPALVLGFPVGFIGAAESKEALASGIAGVPFVTLLGRRGGSAMGAAAVNALAGEMGWTPPIPDVLGLEGLVGPSRADGIKVPRGKSKLFAGKPEDPR